MSAKNKNIRKILWNTSSHYCPVCGVLMKNSGSVTAGDYATLDHIMPKSKFGGNNIENLRLLCRTCNMKRGNDYKNDSFVFFRDYRGNVIPINFGGI